MENISLIRSLVGPRAAFGWCAHSVDKQLGAVMAGLYGSETAEGVRATCADKKQSEIFDVIQDAGSDNLLSALQSKGFAKTRGGSCCRFTMSSWGVTGVVELYT
jgi:hypothetical protein